ncbi:MAG TPA: ABC transporter ATP-binding protein, partial [Massilibacterium sp.]|nr:ABC transporter ATP-binding protein [Massilibacterium sp.]
PTASLDATTQLEILHLLKSISKEQRMAMLFISHDIAAVQFICDRILVLKEGHLVDDFTVEELFSANRHPYTKKLIQYSC